jgi:glycosyltransferase A (GT-A) superfamily protein (DUF2064 family)
MPLHKTRPALIILLEDTNRDKIHSRLTDNLSESEKNRLYTAFLEDTIYTCLNLSNTILKVNYPSDEAKQIVENSIECLSQKLSPKQKKMLNGGNFKTFMSKGESQGERLKDAFEHAFKKGFSPVVLIGCVTPTLSKKALQNAFKQLRKTDVVFGPTLEGSYYLIGLSSMRSEVFEQIDWMDEEAVYSQMVNIVSESSLKWRELDLWYDLRQPEDFEFLIRDINFFRQVGDENSASSTEEVLDEILKKMP